MVTASRRSLRCWRQRASRAASFRPSSVAGPPAAAIGPLQPVVALALAQFVPAGLARGVVVGLELEHGLADQDRAGVVGVFGQVEQVEARRAGAVAAAVAGGGGHGGGHRQPLRRRRAADGPQAAAGAGAPVGRSSGDPGDMAGARAARSAGSPGRGARFRTLGAGRSGRYSRVRQAGPPHGRQRAWDGAWRNSRGG